MEVILRIPDDVAQRLFPDGGDVSRRALEALALEGYRDQTLTLYQVSEMLGCHESRQRIFWGNTMFLCPRSEKLIWTAKRRCTRRPPAAARANNFAA